MSDITHTGDFHGHVAALLHDHDAHYSQTGHEGGHHPRHLDADSGSVLLPERPICFAAQHPSKLQGHAAYADMVNGGSERLLNTLEGILSNPSKGTAIQRAAALAYMERNWPERAAKMKEQAGNPSQLGW